MAELDDILQTLSTSQLMYVAERPWHPSNAAAAKAVGLSEHTIYNWDNKADVERAVNLMQQDGIRLAQSLLRRHLPQAAMELIAALDHRSVTVRLRAAKEILDRGGVVPGQSIDLTSGGEKLETKPDAKTIAEAIAILGGCGKGSCSGCGS